MLEDMQKRSAQDKPDVRPDVPPWAAVLRAWAMSGESDAAENAQRLLDRMEHLYETKQHTFDPTMFATRLAWVRGKFKRQRRLGQFGKDSMQNGAGLRRHIGV